MRFGTRELLFVLLLLAMPGAAWWFVFAPANEQIEAARAEIKAKQQKLDQLELATQHIDDMGAEIDRLAEAVGIFEAKLPAQREVEVVLKDVWELAARHGLHPSSVRTERPVQSSRYTEMPLRMNIIGDFDGFYSFLLDIEQLERITRVPEMKLVRRPRDGDGQMEATFTLNIFFEPRGGDEPLGT